MLTVPRLVRVHLATAAVDFRKGMFGLCGVVKNHLAGDPLQHVWVFYNRRQTDLKVLWFEHGGYVVAHKKLLRGRYRLPPTSGPVVTMTSAELAALLEGLDLSGARRLPRWNPPEGPQT